MPASPRAEAMRGRSKSLLFLASQLTLAFIGIPSGFTFQITKPPAPRFDDHRGLKVIARAADASELETEPGVEAETQPKRDRVIGPDGKTGKQRRAARARLKKAQARNEGKEGPRELSLTFGNGDGTSEARAFYKGANKSWTPEAIVEKFGEAGEVVSLRFWQHGDDSPMGMGVVGYRDTEAARAAVEALNGAEVGGRKLKVSLWKE
mmetsp:Transcript_90414/g.269788  ORF Transcript_90414/g.269788 Transcript_90414/m.269788 type:complete len:207 (-) Transcript_90414:25-645(-)